MECPPVYVNSAIKTVINYEYDCDKSFQEIMCRIDNWINEGSVWVIESAGKESIIIFRPLSGSTYT